MHKRSLEKYVQSDKMGCECNSGKSQVNQDT